MSLNSYAEAKVIEIILADPFQKQANIVSDFSGKIEDYFKKSFDESSPKSDKLSKIINLLAPTGISIFFSSLGMGKIGLFIGLLMRFFHVDVAGMLSHILDEVKSTASSGTITPEQVDSITRSAAQEYSSPSSEQDIQSTIQQFKSHSSLIHDTKMFKLALIDYEYQLSKKAKINLDFLSKFNKSKSTGTSILARILSSVLKIGLTTAGIMVAADFAHELIGDKTPLSGQSKQEDTLATYHSTQTKFPLKSDQPLQDTYPLQNNPQNIENMLVQFAKDTYSGLDGKDNLIISSPKFQEVKNDINWYNIHNPNTSVIFLPSIYNSKKKVVDYFIDDVATRA